MTISSTTLVNSLFVSGANANLVFTKYVDTSVPTVNIFVSNSSDTFGITLFPTGSINGLSFTVGNTTITPSTPLTLPPKTGSNINFANIIVQLDTTNYNTLPVSIQTYDIKFNLVAVTSSLITVTPAVGSTSTTGITYTGGGRTAPTMPNRSPGVPDDVPRQDTFA